MQPEFSGSLGRRTAVLEQIERCVQFALRGASPNRTHDERRRLKRHPFPYPVRLFPTNAAGEVIDDPIVVLGKHLTTQGFDFYFQHPVSHRRVIASFDCEVAEHIEILMDLAWCRFNKCGWYENGGRFLSVVNRTAENEPLNLIADMESVVSSVQAVQL